MRKLIILPLLMVILCLSMGCGSKKPAAPHAPLPEMKVAIAWFNQPREMDDLLAGIMISEQNFVGDKVLMTLDESFQKVLSTASKREFIEIAGSYSCQVKVSKVAKKGTALEYWTQVGACLGADMIVVPQLTEWHERDGGSMGVEHPAAVTMDFYLIDVKKGQLVQRYHFEETQETLTSNLLTIGKFVDRGGKWVTAEDLAREGMNQAVLEFGL